MNDLISRKALREEIESQIFWAMVCPSAILEAIDDAPAVDTVEAVHGRWEKSEYNGFVRCDKCKDVYIDESWLTDGKWNYCPNCGAKMDGERKDNE